jgi:hypothetical protein
MTGVLGLTYHEWLEQQVWERGWPILGLDPDVWRADDYGLRLLRSERGNRKSLYGWEVDHRIRLSDGGRHELGNLRPVHWRMKALLADPLAEPPPADAGHP